ncbi:MAG: hypothetical protein M3O71_00755 [Bacteroidota bacterium]|nr:hypothetical protein [Bacteroidota bacterium]
MIDIKFEGLFTIELLHKYFTDTLCPDFSITPSTPTLSVIKGHKAIVKQYQNKLYAGIQSKAGIPFMPVESGMRMTFYLWLNNPLFANYTNLPAGYNSEKIFYFTNRNNNKDVPNAKQYLSVPIAAYDKTLPYVPGNLAKDNTNKVYRAIRSSNNANKHALTELNFWRLVDNFSYAADNDVLQYRAALSTYNFLTPQSSAAISVFGYNKVMNDYTSLVFANALSFTTPTSSFTLKLPSLPNGKYSLVVNGVQEWIYLNDELSTNRPFGVIDIFNEAKPASCNLVDNVTGALLSPNYSIYFLNRATVWKYVLPPTKTGSITDMQGVYNFTTASNDITSNAPIPLTDSLLVDNLLKFKITVNGHHFTPIPSADPQRLTSLTLGTDTYACSEIYINY